MAAKFGGGGMQGLGSDASYNAGGGGGGGGDVLGAVGSLWGKVASATRESVTAANEELKKRELGKKVAMGWQSTVEATKTGIAAVTDEEAAKKVGDTTKRWWGAVADTTTGILNDLAAPDDEEPAFPRPDGYTNGSGMGKQMEGYGGGSSSSGGGGNVSRQPRKQKNMDDAWDDWGEDDGGGGGGGAEEEEEEPLPVAPPRQTTRASSQFVDDHEPVGRRRELTLLCWARRGPANARP